MIQLWYTGNPSVGILRVGDIERIYVKQVDLGVELSSKKMNLKYDVVVRCSSNTGRIGDYIIERFDSSVEANDRLKLIWKDIKDET